MTSEVTPKFSEEELHDCKSWRLPDVSSKQSVPSAEKEALDKEKNKTTASAKPSLNESIETVEEIVTPMTADELQEISNTAEKEGFESGFKEGIEKGIVEGTEQGFKKGHEEGIAKAKETITVQCEQLQHVIDALLIPLESEQQKLQMMILNMVTDLAKAVVLRDLKQDSSHITQLVDEALNAIPVGADKFSLYLSGQDLEIVEKHVEHFNSRHEKNLILHVDENLLPGGCRLETKQTVVDYTVEQRLQKIIDGFMHKRFASNEPETMGSITAEKPQDGGNKNATDSLSDNTEESLSKENIPEVVQQTKDQKEQLSNPAHSKSEDKAGVSRPESIDHTTNQDDASKGID
ncbi:MAG: flagellar assembly protein FliH [Cellvibrionaceae bacterium]